MDPNQERKLAANLFNQVWKLRLASPARLGDTGLNR
jgi:hypothetical protein